MEGQQEGRAAFRQKSAEIVVALLFLLAGAIVVYDSLRLGAKWAEDGPEAGYFPFIIGLIICIAAAINLVAVFAWARNMGQTFVGVGQPNLVLSVLLPTAVSCGIIRWLGNYGAPLPFLTF